MCPRVPGALAAPCPGRAHPRKALHPSECCSAKQREQGAAPGTQTAQQPDLGIFLVLASLKASGAAGSQARGEEERAGAGCRQRGWRGPRALPGCHHGDRSGGVENVAGGDGEGRRGLGEVVNREEHWKGQETRGQWGREQDTGGGLGGGQAGQPKLGWKLQARSTAAPGACSEGTASTAGTSRRRLSRTGPLQAGGAQQGLAGVMARAHPTGAAARERPLRCCRRSIPVGTGGWQGQSTGGGEGQPRQEDRDIPGAAAPRPALTPGALLGFGGC